ncbi:MAG: permease-like cell division protein FtsX [Bacteroidota bacterium]|nr:permease-like cell division protein FtsX [Bacteroidota bacterium]
MPASQATTTLTTIVGMTLTLVLVGMLAVVAMLGSRWEKQLRQEVRIQVYFQRDLDNAILKTALASVESDVAVEEAKYLDPKSEAEKLEETLGEEFIDFLGYVPLPPAMDVKVRGEWGTSDKLPALADRINDIPGVSEVVWQNNLLAKIEKTILKLFYPLVSFAGICFLIALALMNNTVRLTVYARRFLIRNMQLVGAKPSFIRKPFIKQGVLLGVTSGFLSLALIMGGLTLLKSYSPEASISLTTEFIGVMTAGLTLTGGLLGIVSTTLAVNRYLRLDLGKLH